MSPQKTRWKTIREVLFYPWIILLFIGTLLLTSILVDQSNVIVIAVSAFLVSLFSGVLGGIVVKRLDVITEEKLIASRGSSAYSSLQLLLSNVISMERRVQQYYHRINDKEYSKRINPEVINTYLEEVIGECIRLEEKVIDSMDYWTDVIPEVEIKPVLHLIRELKIEFNEESARLEQVNQDLKETRNKSKDEINGLNLGKQVIMEDLARLKKELLKKSAQIGVPAISESLISGENFTPTTTSKAVHPEPAAKPVEAVVEEKKSEETEKESPKKKPPAKAATRQPRKRKYKEDIFAIFRDGNR